MHTPDTSWHWFNQRWLNIRFDDRLEREARQKKYDLIESGDEEESKGKKKMKSKKDKKKKKKKKRKKRDSSSSSSSSSRFVQTDLNFQSVAYS